MSGSLITQGIGSVQRPRMRVLVSGVHQSSLVSAEIDSNNYARCDTFRLEMIPSVGARWWDVPNATTAPPPLDVTIQGAMLEEGAPEGSISNWSTLIQGGVDTDHYDPIANKLTLEGRDYSSKLIELSTSVDVYLNRTSSEVVTDLAQKAGLKSDIDPTMTNVGQYYQIEHKRHGLAQHSKQTTAWDLCMRLARIERYDLWVSGTTVFFKKQLSDTTPPVVLPIDITGLVPFSPVENLNLQRQAGITRGIKVTVISWDSRQRTVTTGQWPPAGSAVLKAGLDAQQYTFKLPNLTQDRANAEAIAYYNQIRAQQRTLTWEQPGDFVLTPRQRVQVMGTASSYDATYRIDSISRHYSLTGFRQSLTVRNRDLVASEIDGTEGDA